MAKFDEYISGRSAGDSLKDTQDYEVCVASINALRLGESDQTKALFGVYGGLNDSHQDFVEKIALAYRILSSRLEAVKAMIEADTFDGVDAMEAVQADLIQKIDAALEGLQTKIDTLENAGTDEERNKALVSQKAELEDAKKLN